MSLKPIFEDILLYSAAILMGCIIGRAILHFGYLYGLLR